MSHELMIQEVTEWAHLNKVMDYEHFCEMEL